MSTSTCISEFDTEVVMLKRTATYMPWLVCLSAALFFFFIFIQMNLFNAIAPALMQDFQVSAAVIGHLSAQYFYANILCAVPAGLLLDRYSTRRLLIVAMAVTIGCTYGFALSHAVWQAGLFRFVTGMMGSFCLLSCVRLAARWFKPERMALVIGIVVALAMLGGTVAQTPMTLLTDTVGWRAALMWDATSGLVLLGWIIWAVRDFPPRMAQTVLAEQAAVHEAGLWRSLQGMAKNRQNWLGGLYTSLLNLPIFLLGAMWGSLYLVQIHHLTREEASWVTSMIFVGTIIGSSCVGWISDTLRRRRLPMLVGAVVSLVVILAIIYTPHLSLGMLLTGFLLLGIFTSTQIISYPLIAESNPAANVGSAEGLASILILTGGFTQPLFAWLMGLHWNHQIVLGVPVYTFSNYELGLLIMPIAFVLGLVCALCVRETYCRAYQSAPHA